MTQTKTLLAALLAAVALPAGSTAALAAPADPAATASCIARQLPQGARMFRASDGSLRVLAIGRRGNQARWTITGGTDAVRVTRDRGAAGIERSVAGICY